MTRTTAYQKRHAKASQRRRRKAHEEIIFSLKHYWHFVDCVKAAPTVVGPGGHHWVWTCPIEWGTVGPPGMTWGSASGKGEWGQTGTSDPRCPHAWEEREDA